MPGCEARNYCTEVQNKDRNEQDGQSLRGPLLATVHRERSYLIAVSRAGFSMVSVPSVLNADSREKKRGI